MGPAADLSLISFAPQTSPYISSRWVPWLYPTLYLSVLMLEGLPGLQSDMFLFRLNQMLPFSGKAEGPLLFPALQVSRTVPATP